MNHYKRLVILFVLIFFSPLLSSVRAEVIRNFASDITINPDGTIVVKETIQYDFESSAKHGIYRDIPFIKKNEAGKKFAIDLKPMSVADEQGNAYKWSRQTIDDTIRIKIGDPNRTVTGEKVYIITYSVGGALTYFSDHDELYWNSTGTEWPVPLASVSATVHLPVSSTTTACYTGSQGSAQTFCTIQSGSRDVSAVTTDSLSSYEGMTIAVGFPKGSVQILEPKAYTSFWENPIVQLFILVVSLSWYLILPIILVIRWIKYGRDPKTTVGVTSAWFDPPKTKKLRKLTPGETGTLYDETVDFSDIAATVIHLAQRGFLTITEEDKSEFTLTKVTPPSDAEPLRPFETRLYNGIFEDGDIVNLSEAELATTVEKTKTQLYKEVVNEGFFYNNPSTVKTLYGVLALIAFFTGNILLAITAAIFGRGMVKRTIDGSNAQAVAQSLKNFLKSQERQFKFQGDKQLLFEKLLPYAIAFGVEKQWATRFADMELVRPSWYSSNSRTYTPLLFISNLSQTMTSFHSAATPTSSSSGFSSGSSGGGFSGGGGGGGGGGSW